MMKVLQVSTHTLGGAANSCIQLHKGLLSSGVDSSLLYLYGSDSHIENSFDYYNTISNPFSRKIKWLKHLMMQKKSRKVNSSMKGYQSLSLASTPYDLTKTKLFKEADIINLHWVADFLDYQTFFKSCKKPVVWTLHDMNPFSSGYHYVEGFDPSPQEKLVEKNLRVKQNSLRHFGDNLYVVSPSKWLEKESNNSSLFQPFNHYHIPNGLDELNLSKLTQQEARDYFKLSQDSTVFVFIANNLNNKLKGFDILIETLKRSGRFTNVSFLIVGGNKDQILKDNTIPDHIKQDFVFTGYLNGLPEISKAYIAADCFIMPSRQDNLPNTVMESICCGTPVIAFDIGGIPDMVQDGVNGVLCGSVSVSNLREGINRFLQQKNVFDRDSIKSNAISKYQLASQAKAYIDLYRMIIEH